MAIKSEYILIMLKEINEKLNDVIPRVLTIEVKLNKLDCLDSLSSDIKSSTSDILAEVRGCSQSVVSCTDSIMGGIKSCDSLSQVSDQTDQQSLPGVAVRDGLGEVPTKYGLLMSDSDSSEIATKAGYITSCKVEVFNNKQEQLLQEMFSNALEYVLIQDSG